MIDSEEERIGWQVDYLGVLLANESFGRVYVNVEDVTLLGRDFTSDAGQHNE